MKLLGSFVVVSQLLDFLIFLASFAMKNIKKSTKKLVTGGEEWKV